MSNRQPAAYSGRPRRAATKGRPVVYRDDISPDTDSEGETIVKKRKTRGKSTARKSGAATKITRGRKKQTRGGASDTSPHQACPSSSGVAREQTCESDSLSKPDTTNHTQASPSTKKAPGRKRKTKGKVAPPPADPSHPPQQHSFNMDAFPTHNAAAQNNTTATTTTANNNKDNKHCVICMSDIVDGEHKTLHICRHIFCRECIDAWFRKTNPICPSCGTVYGPIVGNQPADGQMSHRVVPGLTLPGYEHDVGYGGGGIEVSYQFPNGVQDARHPQPGTPYSGTYRLAYLPNNAEGQKVLRLLRVAFDRRLVFTVGRSVTTGNDNVVVWNDIHHKTNIHGGSTGFGYPDPTYLNRVQQELASKGVSE